jgi:ribose transport system substrate-binding protein
MGGFEAGFKEVFPDADFRMDEKSGLPTGDGYTDPEVIATVGPYLLANDDVNLFFHTDQGVSGVGIVIRDNNLAGKVWTSGFNVSEQILELIDQDIILVTINQGFDNQSEAAVRACVDYLVDGSVPEDPLAYLEPIVITKEGGEGRESSEEARAKLEQVLAGG